LYWWTIQSRSKGHSPAIILVTTCCRVPATIFTFFPYKNVWGIIDSDKEMYEKEVQFFVANDCQITSKIVLKIIDSEIVLKIIDSEIVLKIIDSKISFKIIDSKIVLQIINSEVVSKIIDRKNVYDTSIAKKKKISPSAFFTSSLQ
jgi:hypothetical protein